MTRLVLATGLEIAPNYADICKPTSECARALASAIITRLDAVPTATKTKLAPILGARLG